jgi:hypothetical protein
MLYNQFQLTMLATEQQIRATRSHKTVQHNDIKRIFRLSSDRAARIGRR